MAPEGGAWGVWRRDPAIVCLAVAVVLSGALLLALGAQLTFITDDWKLVVGREGWGPGVFLDPFGEHIVIAPAFVYKLLLEIFGMSSALPVRIAAIAVFLASAVLLFFHLRARVGDWPALLAAVLILFLGAAFEDFLWPFQIGYFGSVAAGLGMLIALDREDGKGDRIACALLGVSLAFSSLGLPFAAGALANLALSGRPRAGRAYVAALPLALFAVWWLGWGHTAETHLSADNLVELPEYVFDAAAAGLTSLFGLATGDGTEPDQPHLILGQILLVVGLVLAAWRVRRQGDFPRGLAVAAVIACSFWILAGLNATPDRPPTSSRYQYPSAVFLLLIAAELLRGLRIGRKALVASAAVAAAAVWGGVSLLNDEFEERWRPYSDSLRSSLTAIEIARDEIDPAFAVILSPNFDVPARTYLAAVDDLGSPAHSESELGSRPDTERAGADTTLAQALGLSLAESGATGSNVRCQRLTATASGATGATLLRGGFRIANRSPADVAIQLGRFSDGLPVNLGALHPAREVALVIPADRSARPWRLGLVGEGPVELCATAPA